MIPRRTLVDVTGKLKPSTKEEGTSVGAETVKEAPYCPDFETEAEAPTEDGMYAKFGDAVTAAIGCA